MSSTRGNGGDAPTYSVPDSVIPGYGADDRDDITTDTVQFLSPHFDSSDRQSSVTSAVFNLVSTIMGGAVLSLPWAIAQTGVVVGIVSIIFWALMGEFSIYLLIMCARRAGDATYEDVASRAFGKKMKVVVVIQVIMLCWLTVIAYTVLAGSMALKVVQAVAIWNHWALPSWVDAKLSMILISVYVLPRCCATKLSALKWTSMCSVLAMVVLGVVVGIRSVQKMTDTAATQTAIQWWPSSWEGVPYSLPLYSAAFVCHFNVLPMHMELHKPTRRRMRRVLRSTISLCAVIYLIIGTLGYLYDKEDTCDNIMSNFCETDVLGTIGRLALVMVITFNLPLIVIPCRNNLDRLIAFRELLAEDPSSEVVDFLMEEGYPPERPCGPHRAQIRRVSESTLILFMACAAACYVPGVSAVWTITGATVCLMVAFIMPCAFYLKLRWYKSWNVRKVGAALLLVIASVSCVVCTVEAVRHVVIGDARECPKGFNPCQNLTLDTAGADLTSHLAHQTATTPKSVPDSTADGDLYGDWDTDGNRHRGSGEDRGEDRDAPFVPAIPEPSSLLTG